MTPTQIARATLSDPRARRYLALSYAKLDRMAHIDRNAALALLRGNARDGRRALGCRLTCSTVLDKAACILLQHWYDTTSTRKPTE